MCVYVYICMYICIYTHVYIYIYIIVIIIIIIIIVKRHGASRRPRGGALRRPEVIMIMLYHIIQVCNIMVICKHDNA